MRFHSPKMIKIFIAIVSCVVSSVWADVNLGVVDAHRKCDCVFLITNRMSSVCKVTDVRSSCACLVLTADRDELSPGDVLTVKGVFNPAGFEGPVEKTVRVGFDSVPPVQHRLRAEVRVRLGLRPRDAAFGVIRRQDLGRVLTAELVGSAAATAGVTGVKGPKESVFEVRAAADHRLEARFRKPDLLPGTYVETWTVCTTDPEIPEIPFLVGARIGDGLAVSPQMLTVGQEDPVGSKMVILRPEDRTRAFKVLSVETGPRKWGEVRLASRPYNGWQIVVDGVDPAELRQFSKFPFLKVTTDFPGMESFEIPLRVMR